MSFEASAARLRGISAPGERPVSLLDLAIEIERGLPLSALMNVAHQVAPGDGTFVRRLAFSAFQSRQSKAAAADADQAQLPPEDGARVARLAAVWVFSRQVWGSDEEARAFLFRTHAMLAERRPIDMVLANEFGRPLVEGNLGRLQYGSAG